MQSGRAAMSLLPNFLALNRNKIVHEYNGARLNQINQRIIVIISRLDRCEDVELRWRGFEHVAELQIAGQEDGIFDQLPCTLELKIRGISIRGLLVRHYYDLTASSFQFYYKEPLPVTFVVPLDAYLSHIVDEDWLRLRLSAIETIETLSASGVSLSCQRWFQKTTKVTKNRPCSLEEAVDELFSLQNDTLLLQGPPGSGKSSALLAGVSKCCQRGDRVVIIAQNNCVLKNYETKLIEQFPGMNFMRFKSSSLRYINDDILERFGLKFCPNLIKTYQSLINDLKRVEKAQEWDNLRFQVEKLKYKIFVRVISRTKLFLCTPHQFAKFFERRAFPIDTVVIDEASCVKIENIWPIVSFQSIRQVWVAGDCHQLAPFSEKYSSEVSLLDILSATGIQSIYLKQVYRSDRRIFEWSQKYFYPYASARVLQPLILPKSGKQVDEVVLIQCPPNCYEDKIGQSFINIGEAECVLEYSKQFDKNNVILVVPYTAQIKQFKMRSQNSLRLVTADTIQGGESDIVLVSLVRRGQNIGFLKNPKRLNVIMTRAKRHVALFGDFVAYARDPVWRSFIDIYRNSLVNWNDIKTSF